MKIPTSACELFALSPYSTAAASGRSISDPAEEVKAKKPAFNPADFSHDELFQIEAALRLIVERNAEKAGALATP